MVAAFDKEDQNMFFKDMKERICFSNFGPQYSKGCAVGFAVISATGPQQYQNCKTGAPMVRERDGAQGPQPPWGCYTWLEVGPSAGIQIQWRCVGTSAERD